MNDLTTKIKDSTTYIKSKTGDITPEIGLVLGSGLGDLANEITEATTIPYQVIPGFLQSTIKGHKGQLVIGKLGGKVVIAMQGRFHYYEGYPINEITLPIRVMAELGITTLLVTNAAGAVNKTFTPGDLMLITDHINFGFKNSLIGKNLDKFGSRFTDTSESYSPTLQKLALQCAKQLELPIKQGVYQFSSGPSYETPAETRVARALGTDAVGMSTVPEVLVALHSGIQVLGISCITNMASGITDDPLNHAEVIENGRLAKKNFIRLIKKIIENSNI